MLNRKIFFLLAVQAALVVVLAACGLVPSSEEAKKVPGPTVAPRIDAMPRPTATVVPLNPVSMARGLTYLLNTPRFSQEPKRGGFVNIATNLEPLEFNPRTPSASVLMAIEPAYSKLVRCKFGPVMEKYDPYNCELEGDLVESWSISEDGREYRLNLRPGVRWHNIAPVNGRELKAADVVFSLGFLGSGTSQWGSQLLAAISDVRALDDRTVIITTRERNVDLLPSILGFHSTLILPEDVLAAGESFSAKVIGTGPFVLAEPNVEVNNIRSLRYVRNESYFRPGLPYLDGFTITVIPDSRVQRAGLATGQFDYASNGSVFIRKSQMEELLRANPTLAAFQFDDQAVLPHLGFRTDYLPYSDVKMRRALSMAIDRKAILDAVAEGEGNIQPPIPWYHIFDRAPGLDIPGRYYQYDPTASRRLLAEVGIEGTRVRRLEYPLGFDPVIDEVAALLRKQMAAAGIELELAPSDTIEYIARDRNEAFFDLIWRNERPYFSAEGDIFLRNRSGNLGTGVALAAFAPQQVAAYSDPNRVRLYELTSLQRSEMDPLKRRQVLKAIWDLELDQVWRPGLYTLPSFRVHSSRLHNIVPNVHHLWPQWGGAQWEIVWVD